MPDNVAILDDHMWQSFLKKTGDKLSQPNNILATAYATRGFRDIIEHFTQEKGPSGPWAELSPARRRQRGEDAKILQDTGHLRNSITPRNYRDEKSAIRVFAAASYSGQHDRGEKGMPQRAFMWLSVSALKDMAQIVLKLLVKD